MKKLCLILLSVMLFAVCAAAEEPAYVCGGNGAELSGLYYMRIDEGTADALVRISEGGHADIVLRADELGDMVAMDDRVYCLARTDSSWALMGINAEDILTVYQFEPGVDVKEIGARDGILFMLLDDKLHIMYPQHGMCVLLLSLSMDEFVLHDDYAYYIPADDMSEYALSDGKGNIASTEAGVIRRVNLSTGKYEAVYDGGAADLQIADGRLYFHNYADSYLMGSGENMSIEGKLYSYDIQTGYVEKLTDIYDWEFYARPGSVSTLRAGVIVGIEDGGMERIICAIPTVVDVAFTGSEYIVFDWQNMVFGIFGK